MTASRRLPIVGGAIAGIVSWVAGYVLTYLVVASEVRDSPLHRIVEALGGEPATYEIVGWVFYNAHLVDTVIQDVPLVGSHATTYIGGEDGFTMVLYAIPIASLLLAGIALAAAWGVSDVTEGTLVGITVLPGYLIASVAGVVLFEVTVGGASGAPDFLAGVVLAGIAYPLLVAGAGGLLVGLFRGRGRRQ